MYGLGGFDMEGEGVPEVGTCTAKSTVSHGVEALCEGW